ncbi:MAG: Regulatory protein AfsR [Chloroflexi bacterium]|nr:Regulatory protein AfsR [Chloroflexota bacterium]
MAKTKQENGLLRAVFVVTGLTLLIVALSLRFVPGWVSIPGGAVLLTGIALNAVLEAGSKFKEWIDLLTPQDEESGPKAETPAPSQQIHQGGETNVGADHVEDHAPQEKRTPVAPHTVEAPVPDFLGRDDELADLLAHFERGALITGLTGGAGIGKTELARALVERLAEDYPDALKIDLKGADISGEEPLTPAQAMRRLLEPFYPGQPLPGDEDALRGLYRQTFTQHLHLLLLDNALDAPQVRPLVPPQPSAAIVTSRQHFTLPRCGLRPLRLDVLAPDAARALLHEMAPELRDVPDEEVDTLAERCGRLPLALRVSASLLNDRDDWDLPHLLKRMEDERGRLSALRRPGDPDLDVEAALSLSYQELPEELREKFATLGIFPAPFTRQAASAVWDEEEDATDHALGILLKRCLLRYQKETGRYNLLDLTRLFALRELEKGDHYLPALQRHARYYLEKGSDANTQYKQGGESVLLALGSFTEIWPHLAAAWERISEARKVSEVEAIQGFAEAWLNDFPGRMPYLLDLHLPPAEKIPYLQTALKAAQRLEDHSAQGVHLGTLGNAYADLGQVEEAIGYYERALEISREIGDRRGEGADLGNLGIAYADLGQVEEAIGYYEQALEIAREIGDRRGEGSDLGGLGSAYRNLGQVEEAIGYYEQALEISREIGDRRGEGNHLANLGLAYDELGEIDKARRLWRQALAIYEAIKDPRAERVRGWLEE